MILSYTFIFIFLAFILLINSGFIIFKEKCYIFLPVFSKKVTHIMNLRYQAYLQLVTGLIFFLYSTFIHYFNIEGFFFHLIFTILTVFFISLMGHMKYFYSKK